MVNSAHISSAIAVRPAPSSRCLRTCSSDGRPATTIVCSISAAPSQEICSSCPRLHFWTPWPKTNLPKISLQKISPQLRDLLPQSHPLPHHLHPFHRCPTVRWASVL